MFISFDNGDTFKRVSKSSNEYFYLLPDNKLVTTRYIDSVTAWLTMVIHSNASEEFGTDESGELRYLWHNGDVISTNDHIRPSQFGFSQNGRFLVYSIDGGYASHNKVMIVDLASRPVTNKFIGQLSHSSELSIIGDPSVSVSNDGAYVAVGGFRTLDILNIGEDASCTTDISIGAWDSEYCLHLYCGC